MMGRPASARRGQPVVALAVILMIWTVARAAMWDPTFAARTGEVPLRAAGTSGMVRVVEPPPAPKRSAASPGRERAPVMAQTRAEVREGPKMIGALPGLPDVQAGPSFVLLSRHSGALAKGVPAAAKVRPASPRGKRRWSFERWLLMRAGSGDAAQAVGAASYGASQAGAIARFRLGQGQPQDGYGYARASVAINAPGKDKEVALGLSIRPKRDLPLRVLAEARVYHATGAPVRMRPVVTVVTELPWQNLPGGFRFEAYGQAGYAGGANPTAFFDAQTVVDRSVAKAVGVKRDVRLGAGVWAGGQKGAVRLDVGPRVSMPLDLGDGVPSRIALDWRMRVAGNANPASGPALTIASSF